MSAFTDALAGFLSSSDAATPAATNGNRNRNRNGNGGTTPSSSSSSGHQIFMSTKLIPTTIKLQKEIGRRRMRDVQPRLKESLAALKAFETEPWPPTTTIETDNPKVAAVAVAASKFPSALEAGLNALDDDASVATTDIDMDDDAITIATIVDDNAEADAERANTTWDATVGEGQKLSAKENAMLRHHNDDTNANNNNNSDGNSKSRSDTNYSGNDNGNDHHDHDHDKKKLVEAPMHKSIEEVLAVFSTILKHPSRTSKVCELAMDCIQLLVRNNYISGRAGGRDDLSGSGSQAIAQAEREGKKDLSQPPSLLHHIMEAVASCSNYNSDIVQTAACKTFRALITSKSCGVHEGSLLLALRSAFHVYLVGKTPTTKDVAKASLIDMLRSVFGRFEAQEARLHTITQSGTNASKTPKYQDSKAVADDGAINVIAPLNSQYHTDGYVLFRALCKLSSKEIPDSEPETNRAGSLFSSPPDLMALNNKILSLELILAVMEFSGNAFCRGEKFIYLVQNYLCVGLLKNCTSNHTNVAFLSQKIFLLLIHKFKANLKQEIEVFLSNIFLKVLESPNASFKQKALVVESLRSLCRDPVILTQIFLNYDCDFDAMNLYKDIVHNLSKLSGKYTSTPSGSLTKKEAEEIYELSLAGIEVLVSILKAFLKALNLPAGDPGSDESAGEKLRAMLSLDIELVTEAKRQDAKLATLSDASVASTDDSDIVATAREMHSKSQSAPGSSDGVGSESSSQVAGKIVDAFELKRNQEQNFEMGSVKFTLSLKSGLQFFIDNGFTTCDAKGIALFFLQRKDTLDKTQMGEVLGREPYAAFIKGDNIDPEKGGPGFFVRVLHHYAAAIDFKDIPFDNAIRVFLSGFRLPGEAQKIDRIMEKFAERYTLQNPEVFPSADTAFVLGFSVIMLNTDLHNPSIKPERRMTLASFIRNNRGISENGSDLPRELLEGIFNRIKTNPFSLKEDDDARERVTAQQSTPYFDTSMLFEAPAFFGTSTGDRKRENFKKEREEMMAATTQLIRRRPQGKASKPTHDAATQLTDSVSPADVVKPMFDATWGAVIGILSQVLECSDDPRSISVCLNGFVYAVRLASHSHMSLARDTFVTSLAKFTFLGSIKEMKRKNIESIRTLLSIAVIDGEYLGESWGPVLQCTSQLARLRLSASGLDLDELFLADVEGQRSRTSTRLATDIPSDSRKNESSNGRAVLEAVNEVLIDKVFSNTVNLSAQSLGHFIEQLIEVSTAEINGSTKSGISGVAGPRAKASSGSAQGRAKNDDGPSIFSLQKLVEVADFNMDVRPRLVWVQMWDRMAEFFATISSNENTNVSVYAIDSLKQLSFKFLDKPELSEFNFQRIYLRPFLHVMQQEGTREDIRELVLRCLENIVRTKSHNLRSGWKVIFSILECSAEDPSEKINFLGLAILQGLLDDHLDELCRLENASEEETAVSEQHHILPAFANKRSADVEDFVGLCRASSSFVQARESTSPRPMGLSMRALCHTTIYADLLAGNRVLPPVYGAQSTDPLAPGYTYAGLGTSDALEMVLWRSLLEGLGDGIKSRAKSSAAGLGCLVQRGSVLALRAIFIRHGSIFSVPQWEAILRDTILPALQFAAENEVSPVVGITSESPHLSNVDFLVDALPIPPPANNPGLKKFESIAMNNESAPKRPFGKAELMLEASFTDMRHGGDGDLSRAYILAQKDATSSARDQPFPDSWIATTAPLALGLLTDLTSEIFFSLGAEGRERLWPLVARQFLLWCVGRPFGDNNQLEQDGVWWPCEALVRVACNEIQRLPERVTVSFPELYQFERVGWTSTFLTMFASALTRTVQHEKKLQRDLFWARNKSKEPDLSSEKDSILSEALSMVPAKAQGSESEAIGTNVSTLYGNGEMVEQRMDCYENSVVTMSKQYTHLTVNIINLDFGAKLYSPNLDSISFNDTTARKQVPTGLALLDLGEEEIDNNTSFRSDSSKADTYWLDCVQALKVRCVAAHCLQNGYFHLFETLVPLMELDVAMKVLRALQLSCKTSEEAVQDDNLRRAFQEAIFTEWGDGVEEVEMALSNVARMSHLHGSDMFFLTQEADSTKAMVQMLGMLYQGRIEVTRSGWDRKGFAKELLLATMKEALCKFQDSEERDGHLVDPNVWRNTCESGGKVALYCTSFADVVVGILGIMLALDQEKFNMHLKEFFPVICSLIRAESREIRNLVQRILAKQVAPLIDVNPDNCIERMPMQRSSLD